MQQHEWEKAREKIKLGESVTMSIDGYEVTLKPVKYNGFSTAVLPFINGEYKSEWLTHNCEERRRFYSARIEEYRGIGFVDCRAVWTSFELMKSHFEKNNSSIELLKR